MKEFFYQLRYAFWWRQVTGHPWEFCWYSAKAADIEQLIVDEYSPRDAVHEELSYWND